jgi:hypothetical protein
MRHSSQGVTNVSLFASLSPIRVIAVTAKRPARGFNTLFARKHGEGVPRHSAHRCVLNRHGFKLALSNAERCRYENEARFEEDLL